MSSIGTGVNHFQSILIDIIIVNFHYYILHIIIFNTFQYDLSASQFSPDGRVFQVEYAQKAVENSGYVKIFFLLYHQAFFFNL